MSSTQLSTTSEALVRRFGAITELQAETVIKAAAVLIESESYHSDTELEDMLDVLAVVMREHEDAKFDARMAERLERNA